MVNVIGDDSNEGQTGYRHGTFSEYVLQTNGLVQLFSYRPNSSAQMDQATQILLGSDGF